MLKYIIKRIALMLLTFLIIISICFVLIRLLPNPIVAAPGQDIQVIIARRHQMGYCDEQGNPTPIIQQYWKFIQKTLIGGDWGIGEKTMYKNLDCWEVFIEKLPFTVVVNLYSILFSIPLGLALGIYAALRKNKWQDAVISTSVMVFVSVPSYIYAFLVQYILCFKLKWFPYLIEEGTNLFTWKMFVSMLPAVLSLSFGSIAGFARYSRAELTEVLTSEFMLLARTKGLTKSQAVVRHALKNAMVVIFPMILGEFISIMSGSLIIEQIFGIPGVGELYINSINALEYNYFMLLTAFYTLIGLASGIVIDISYGIIDPRIRMGAR